MDHGSPWVIILWLINVLNNIMQIKYEDRSYDSVEHEDICKFFKINDDTMAQTLKNHKNESKHTFLFAAQPIMKLD